MTYKYPEGNVFYRKLDRSYPVCVKGEGIYLYDQEGKKYIDGSSGPLCVNTGHGVTEIIEAAREQAQKVAYVHGTQFTTLATEEFSKKLFKVLPGDLDKIFFVSSGSAANEAALLLAHQYQLDLGNSLKYRVISSWMSFFGSTIGARSMSGTTSWRKHALSLLLNFPHIPAPYCYRCPFGRTYPECNVRCARILEETIELEGEETISAFIAEPIVGSSAAAVVPPKEYYPIIRDICNKFNILFIADEVMCGYGRTGKYFAVEHWGVIPDIITMGKGISSGYIPLGAMATKKRIIDVIKNKSGDFAYGQSSTNNPISSAVGLAVLEYFEKHNLVERSAKRGEYLFRRLNELKEFSFVGDVRGKGLMAGIEFVKNKGTKAPFSIKLKFTEKVIDKLFKNGLITFPVKGFLNGIDGDAIMVAPPLIVEEKEIDEIINILQKVFGEIEKEV